MALGSNCMAPSFGNTVTNVVLPGGQILARGQGAKAVKIGNHYRAGKILIATVGGNAQPGNAVKI